MLFYFGNVKITLGGAAAQQRVICILQERRCADALVIIRLCIPKCLLADSPEHGRWLRGL